ncbi:MAG TPA: hypothetical protein VI298_14600 [Geobacteraceae bacterium]
MTKRFILAALLLLTTAGCAAYRKELDGNPPFSAHHFRAYDLEIAWSTEQSGDTVSLAGTATNLRGYFLRDLELTARLVDKEGKVLARETFTDFPTYLPSGTGEPFRMKLRVPPGSAVERIRFSYGYWLAEAAPYFRRYNDTPYFGGFVSPP